MNERERTLRQLDQQIERLQRVVTRLRGLAAMAGTKLDAVEYANLCQSTGNLMVEIDYLTIERQSVAQLGGVR